MDKDWCALMPINCPPLNCPPHLGGHENHTWVDRPVLSYLQAQRGVRSLLDVGCGPGGMLNLAAELGIDAIGVDGDPAVQRPGVLLHDYTTGPLVFPPDLVDLIWCVEFVEHVDAACIPNFLATFDAGRMLWLTHALPGQGGHHHVNEQPPAYWQQVLQDAGWTLDTDATTVCRAISATPFGRATGMVWQREGSAC